MLRTDFKDDNMFKKRCIEFVKGFRPVVFAPPGTSSLDLGRRAFGIGVHSGAPPSWSYEGRNAYRVHARVPLRRRGVAGS